MNRNILVSGATGFLGSSLARVFSENGYHVIPLSRTRQGTSSGSTWDPSIGRVNLDPSPPFDSVVHLAGENIAQRWTRATRERIRSSRVDSTRLLCGALADLPQPPRVLVCASATGFYGDRGDEILDEQSRPGAGFLPEVCRAWEEAAEPARQCGIRVVHLRLGLVLARDGGALAKMLPLFRLGLGARLGQGRQYWSWIVLDDVMRVIELVLKDESISGAVNTVAPEAATNANFTKSLARALHRPVWLAIPAFAVRTLFGQMGYEALLASARVQPRRLLAVGFNYRYPNLETAFDYLLATQPFEGVKV